MRGLLQGLEPTLDPGKQWLTIHLRSGDVFGSRNASGYGQPPLAFYRLVIQAKDWGGVTLVYQDTSNPVVLELEKFCKAQGFRVILQTGTILEDLRVLLGAKNLVAGRGTFIPGIAGLSSECRRIYFFEDKCNMVPQKSGIEFIKVIDKGQVYRVEVLSNNWNNTPQQRQLMIEYPISSLEIQTS